VSDTFDYIVIGSGSAGSLMANRLSADPANRVALIEAGPSDRQWPVNIKTAMPVGNIFLIPMRATTGSTRCPAMPRSAGAASISRVAS
jgi:choline dehydrogenase-like flavoprotein